MTPDEFSSFRARLIPSYAAERVHAGDWGAAEAEEKAARRVDELLPSGAVSPGMLLRTAEAADGRAVGMVWVALDRPQPGATWIYYIEVEPAHRGKGYGRSLLRAAEQECARQGATSIGLNVFGGNISARTLYETSGYQITAMNMRKSLG